MAKYIVGCKVSIITRSFIIKEELTNFDIIEIHGDTDPKEIYSEKHNYAYSDIIIAGEISNGRFNIHPEVFDVEWINMRRLKECFIQNGIIICE